MNSIQGLTLANKSVLKVNVSRKNNRVKEVLPFLKNIVEQDMSFKSVSDLYCKLFLRGLDSYIKEHDGDKVEGAYPHHQDHHQQWTQNNSSCSKAAQDNNTGSFIKRLLDKKAFRKFKFHKIPTIDKFHELKINGKSVSRAFRDGDIDIEEASNMYTSACVVYADMKNDRHLSRYLPVVRSKNDTKKPHRIKNLRDRIMFKLNQNLSDPDYMNNYGLQSEDEIVELEHIDTTPAPAPTTTSTIDEIDLDEYEIISPDYSESSTYDNGIEENLETSDV